MDNDVPNFDDQEALYREYGMTGVWLTTEIGDPKTDAFRALHAENERIVEIERKWRHESEKWSSRLASMLSHVTCALHIWEKRTGPELQSIGARMNPNKGGRKSGDTYKGDVPRRKIVEDWIGLLESKPTAREAARELDWQYDLTGNPGELSDEQVDGLIKRLKRWRRDERL